MIHKSVFYSFEVVEQHNVHVIQFHDWINVPAIQASQESIASIYSMILPVMQFQHQI